jgi:hypothetical protein
MSEFGQAEGSSFTCNPCLLDNMERKERANFQKTLEEHRKRDQRDQVRGDPVGQATKPSPHAPLVLNSVFSL